MRPSDSPFFTAGGTLRQDAPSYVERQADADLFDGLLAGDFCYALTSRQMGKSSLMVRTAARLKEAGVAVASLDLTGIGQNVSVDQWYLGLLNQLGQPLGIEDELEAFWFEREAYGPLQRWMAAVREVVLPRVSGQTSPPDPTPTSPPDPLSTHGEGEAAATEWGAPLSTEWRGAGGEVGGEGRLVVFVDEIDAVRSLPFSTDEFFAAVRACHNRRTENPDFERLTFCLLGVAAPSDLIQDVRTTPFNIGRRIELVDFSGAQAAGLARGLHRPNSDALVGRVLHWTGGHPYLTQRFCRAIAEDAAVQDAGGVDRLCRELFLSRSAREKDDNLLFVRDRLLREGEIGAVLDLYARVRSGRRVADDPANPLVTLLKLSGIAVPDQGALRVRNRIYASAFDRAWIDENMPDAEVRRQRAAYRRGVLRTATVAGAVVALVAGLAITAAGQARIARHLAARANDGERTARRLAASLKATLGQLTVALSEADVAQLRATGQAKLAREAEARERVQRQAAQRARLAAEDQAGIARDRTREATTQRARAQAREEEARRYAYVADMSAAARLAEAGDVVHAKARLLRYLPRPGAVDPRGFEWRHLWSELHRTVPARIFTPHGPPGAALTQWSISPDGRRAACEFDSRGGVRAAMYDLDRGTRITSLEGWTPGLTLLGVSGDGRRVVGDRFASGVGGLSEATEWDAASGRRVASCRFVRSGFVAVAPDGSILATPAGRGLVRLWDAATGRERPPLTGMPAESGAAELFFSADGRALTAYASLPGRPLGFFHRWDVATGRTLASAALDPDLFGIAGLQIDWSDGGMLLALAYPGSGVRLWDAARGGLLPVTIAPGATFARIVLSADGHTLATFEAGRARLWSLPDGRAIGILPEEADVRSGAYIVDSGRRLVLALGGSFRTYSIERIRARLEGAPGTVRLASLSADGRRLATAGAGGAIDVWSAVSRARIARIPAPDAVSAMAISPDGRFVAASSDSPTARHPNGTQYATGPARVEIRDAATGQPVSRLTLGPCEVGALAFSPDGRTLACGATDFGAGGAVQLWDVRHARRIGMLSGHQTPVVTVGFSPDGRTLVSGDIRSFLKFWDLPRLQEITTLQIKRHEAPTPAGEHPAIAFAPGGRTVAMGSDDGTVTMIDLRTFESAGALQGSTGPLAYLAFSSDGRTLLTGSRSGEARLWSRRTGQELMAVEPDADSAGAGAFLPAGKGLVLAGLDSTVRTYPAASFQAAARQAAIEAARPQSIARIERSAPPPRHPGLAGRYYALLSREDPPDDRMPPARAALRLTRVDPRLDFAWTDVNLAPARPPGPGVPSEYFAAEWSGAIRAPVAAAYHFETVADDGVRIYLDGRRIIDDWQTQWDIAARADVYLSAGWHRVVVRYFNGINGGSLQLRWNYPFHTGLHLVPPEDFGH